MIFWKRKKKASKEDSCQCGHYQCYHAFGTNCCLKSWCACSKFILKKRPDEFAEQSEATLKGDTK